MTTLRHLEPVPDHPESGEEEAPCLSIATLRQAAQQAGWTVDYLAEQLGVSAHRLRHLQRQSDELPDYLAEAVERVLILAGAAARRRKLEAEALSIALASWNADVRLWERWMSDEGSRSPETIATYVLHVSWLAAAMAHLFASPWAVHSHALEDWLTTRSWSLETRRKVLVSLRCFYTWALLEGRCDRSPLAGIAVRPPRAPGPERRFAWPDAWAGPVRAYLDYLHAAGRSVGTRRLYEHYLGAVAQNHADPWAVTLEDLTRMMGRPDLAPDTRKSMRSALRGFYRWAEDTNVLPINVANPAAKLPTVRVPRALPRPTPDDAVLEALEKSDHRVHLALSVGIYTGLRRSEIVKVHSNDIGTDALLVHGKGGKERLVPLHPHLAMQLRAELRRRADRGPLLEGWGRTVPPANGWLFPSSSREGQHLTADHLGKLITRALPGHWTTHTLRHRFATQAYRVNRDIRAVQELLGHAKPETTAVYAGVPGESLRNAVTGVGPVTMPEGVRP